MNVRVVMERNVMRKNGIWRRKYHKIPPDALILGKCIYDNRAVAERRLQRN